MTHAVFNLPAAGVELLDCFRGLDYDKQGLPRPLAALQASILSSAIVFLGTMSTCSMSDRVV